MVPRFKIVNFIPYICTVHRAGNVKIMMFNYVGQFVDNKAKGRISKWVLQEKSTPNFLKKEHFLLPDTHTLQYVSGVKKCLFFRKFGVLCFLVAPVLRFVFLPHYQWIQNPLEHLTLSFSWKYSTFKSRLLFSQKDPSKMFGWVLNMPLKYRIWIPRFVAGAQTTWNMLVAAIRRSHSWKNHTRLTLGKSLWRHQSNSPTFKIQQIAWTQPTLTCSKSTIETVEKGEKYVQS